MIRGVDVSIYQPKPDWTALVKAGFGSFAYARCCDGTHLDALHGTHIREARMAGVPIGSYQFGHPSLDVNALASFFIQNADVTELRPVIDMEALAQGNAVPANAGQWADTWCELVKQTLKVEPIIYASTSYYNTMVTQLQTVQGWDWWCAEYDNNTPDQPKTKWPYVAHQYAGNVPLVEQVGLWDLDAVYADSCDVLRVS